MKLHLYILRELLVAFAFTLGGILVLTLPAITVVAVHKLAGVEITSVLMFIPIIQAGLIPYVLPLAFLLAVVSTYGRLAADNEWTAIRMSGRNPATCLLPGAVMALALGVLTHWLLAEKLPEIRMRESTYAAAALSETFRHLGPGRTEIHLDEFYVSAASRQGDDFIDAFVYVPGKDGDPPRTILAERVRFTVFEDSIQADFTNARNVSGGQDLQLGSMKVQIDLASLREPRKPSTKLRHMKSAQMSAILERNEMPEKRDLMRYEIHARRALASTCLMFLLLGASTALILKRGTQLMAMAVAVAYVLAYYLLSMRVGKLLAQANHVPPEAAAWTVAVVGLLAGLMLTWKALRE